MDEKLRGVLESVRRECDELPVAFWGGCAAGATAAGLVVAGVSFVGHRVWLRRVGVALQRAETEAATARRVARRDVDNATEFATQKLAKSLLPVADSLKLATASHTADARALAEGFEMLDKQFVGVLAGNGIEAFGAVGDAFDPSKHEAIAKHEAAAGTGLCVTAVHALGYSLRGRVIRAATVTAGPPTSPLPEEDVDEDGTSTGAAVRRDDDVVADEETTTPPPPPPPQGKEAAQ